MAIESLPTFTKPARQRWESIPANIRQRLLSNVWCGQCRHETTITNFSGTIKGGDFRAREREVVPGRLAILEEHERAHTADRDRGEQHERVRHVVVEDLLVEQQRRFERRVVEDRVDRDREADRGERGENWDGAVHSITRDS